MAKRQSQPVAAEPEKVEPTAPVAPTVPEGQPDPNVMVKPAKKAKQTSFTVYKNGSPVRTYSVEQHGENAEDLANEFCAHSGDEVK